MRVFNKKLNRLLAIMLASVMGATSLPATQVSADTPSSEYDISKWKKYSKDCNSKKS